MKRKPRIVTTFIFPAIPIRGCDWEAHYDGYEELGSCFGSTERQAVNALLDDDLINERLES